MASASINADAMGRMGRLQVASTPVYSKIEFYWMKALIRLTEPLKQLYGKCYMLKQDKIAQREASMYARLLFVLFFGVVVSSVQAQAEDPWQPIIDIIDASELENMVVGVGTEDGILFVHTNNDLGELAPFMPLPIASSSKWLTAATIMQLVDEGVMSLEDQPQDYLNWWTDDPNDPRSQITLAQLLSFTSGLSGEPNCLQQARTTPEACARDIYERHHTHEPGTVFYYSSTHMHIAGIMATSATGESFNALFQRLIAEPLNMQQTRFDRPSTSNPFLAGGATSTAYDYSLFLEGLLTGEIVSESRDLMFMDWTAEPIELLASPLQNAWHYGLGTWLECWDESGTWVDDCADTTLVSAGGGLGWFPWIDLENGYYGIVARRGLPLTGAVGPSIELAYEIRQLIVSILDANN